MSRILRLATHEKAWVAFLEKRSTPSLIMITAATNLAGIAAACFTTTMLTLWFIGAAPPAYTVVARCVLGAACIGVTYQLFAGALWGIKLLSDCRYDAHQARKKGPKADIRRDL